MTNTTKQEPSWLTTTELAHHFGVSVATVSRWSISKGFPDDAKRWHQGSVVYNVTEVTNFLLNRPQSTRRPYKHVVPGEIGMRLSA